MLQRRVLPYLGVMIVMVSTPALAAEKARQLSEKQKIEGLLRAVGGLGKDVKFVRKGVELDVSSAVEFLRAKATFKSDEIHSAKDFVRVCSTAPDGGAYILTYPDGSRVELRAFFESELTA